jgi:ribonuclease HII
MKIAGVDEAGKGSVVGSMFVAGVIIEETSLRRLENMGVKDSKVILPNRRALLAVRIQKVCTYCVHEVTAEQIDELRSIMTMNEIVVKAHARVLRKLKPDRAYVDASDVDTSRFAERVATESGVVSVIAEHKADKSYPIVSAASIIAKVTRDKWIKELEDRVGLKIGSGYPSDQTTIKFLRSWLREYGKLPIFTRHSWKTAQNALTQYENDTGMLI